MRRTSLATSALNVLLRPATAGIRTPDRTFDALVVKAERKTRADAAAVPEFVDDLRLLLHSFAACPGLSPMGWQSVVSDIGVRLENRLRVDRLIHQFPEIEDEPIEDPVVIVGLPRTATTLAHNIIAGSEGHRGPALWELLFTDIDRGEGARRAHIEDTRKMARAFMRLAPAFRVIHPLDAEKPDECNYLLPHGSSHLARADMPDYDRWQRSRHYLPDYGYLKQAVQVLQHGRPRRRWVLKSPMHLAHLPELLAVFPGTTIVWTHRDPVEAIGSVCSMVETTQALHVRRPDRTSSGGRGWSSRPRPSSGRVRHAPRLLRRRSSMFPMRGSPPNRTHACRRSTTGSVRRGRTVTRPTWTPSLRARVRGARTSTSCPGTG